MYQRTQGGLYMPAENGVGSMSANFGAGNPFPIPLPPSTVYYRNDLIKHTGAVSNSWPDLLGHAPMHNQVGVPGYIANAGNGFPAVEVLDITMGLQSDPTAYPDGGSFTMMVAYIPEAVVGGAGSSFIFGNTNPAGGIAFYEQIVPRDAGFLMAGVAACIDGALVVAPQVQVITHSPGSTRMWIQGVEVVLTNAADNPLLGVGVLAVGLQGDGLTFGHGKLQEALATNVDIGPTAAVTLSDKIIAKLGY